MMYKMSEQALVQWLEDELVLLDMESGRYFGLDAVGARAWQLLTELGDIDAVARVMLGEYAVDAAVLRRDLEELVQSLAEAGLIVAAPGETPPQRP